MELDYINSELYKNAFIKLASVVEIRYEREYKKKPFLFPKSIIQHVTNSHRQIYISHPDPSEPTFLTTFLISLLPQKCLKFNMSKTKLIISTSDLLVFQRFPFLTPSFIQGGQVWNLGVIFDPLLSFTLILNLLPRPIHLIS